MSPSNFLLSFFLLLSLHIITASVLAVDSPSRPSSCRPDQRDALSRFNNSFSMSGSPLGYGHICVNASYPKTALWRDDEDCCSWEGVTCDNSTGDVVGLDLSCARLHGAINSNSPLFSLRKLKILSLAGNDLLGSIILSEMRVFLQMTHLNLSSSSISGVVPMEISQLSKLVSLDLSDNRLEMQNPTMRELVRSLTALEELDLSYVNMSAVVPTSLMNITSSLISLRLSHCSLGGKFPENIFRLPNLQRLDLSSNFDLHGSLPESNWSSGLVLLSLGDCSFNGGLPRSIRSLPLLTYLDLSGNNFTGDVDFQAFSALENLRFLGLSGLSVSGVDATDANNAFPKLETLVIYGGILKNFPCFLSSMPELGELYLTGSIVSYFPGQCVNNGLSLPQLQTLEMFSCNLTKFPSFLSHSKRLTYLDLGGNMIEEIPGWFWGIGIDTLRVLHLQDNLIQGSLRLPWKRLAYLNIRNNSFAGPLPIPPAPSLRDFRVSKNHFSGSVSPSISQLTHLLFFDLSQNNLSDVFPQYIRNLTILGYLDLSNNLLTGPLPDPSQSMYYYSASNNNFTGEIPSSICSTTNLFLLDLSNNGLTGNLPQCLKNVTPRLLHLNLQVNRFHGLIPDIFSKGCGLISLDFSRNHFEGALPRSLSNCQLESLDVGDNRIIDSFPSWLGDIPLKVLSLRSNKFHGSISVSNGTNPLSKIRVLDLSNNSFDSNLPDNLIDEIMTVGDDLSGGNTYMSSSSAGGPTEYFEVMLILKGVVTDMVMINVQFAMLDLSSNHFWGEIPGNIGSLKLVRGLNLSHNGFTGTIPPTIGNLTNLESLDLSDNHLVGGIPSELVQLSSLGVLNLSRNNLTGRIPLGGHFNTFPAGSFKGNPGLCGIPLTESCSQGHTKEQPPVDNSDDETVGWFEWKFVVMGFGSGVVIGVSLGYMAMETGKPLWLARMVIQFESRWRKRSNRKYMRRNARM